MKYYYITGASRGIGRSVAEELLADEDNFIIGISRTAGLEHPRYQHLPLDLSQSRAVADFQFGLHAGATLVSLINNAGFIEPRYLGRSTPAKIIENHAINTIAPALLINAFLATYSDTSTERIICTLTSGAGSVAIPGGALYCASKAGLEMMMRALQRETEMRGDKNLHLLLVNPGNVDTAMHEVLRTTDDTEWPLAKRFRQLKDEGKLAAPQVVARKICRVLREPALLPDILVRTDDLTNEA